MADLLESSSSTFLRKFWIQFAELQPIKIQIGEDKNIDFLKEVVKLELPNILGQIDTSDFYLRYYHSEENLQPDSSLSLLDASASSARTPLKIILKTIYPFKTAATSGVIGVMSPITGVNIHSKMWSNVVLDKTVKPSKDFLAQLEKNGRVWSMNSVASCRTVIDLFLRDVLARDEFHATLRIFCDLSLSAEATIGNNMQKISGQCDYTIGFAAGRPMIDYAPPKDSHIVALVPNKAWVEEEVWQCIAQAAVLFKTRKLEGKKDCNVWGIVSDATIWKFLHIDNDGQLFITRMFDLDMSDVFPTKIVTVYQYVHYIVKSCYLTSPHATPIK